MVPWARHFVSGMMPKEKLTIAVLGCGAMGSVYAGTFAEAGHKVWGVDVWKEHVEHIRKHGLRVQGPTADRTVRIHATTDAGEVDRSDLVIIATKASAVGAVAKKAARLVKDDGLIVSIQNGVGAGERIAQYIDVGRVLLGIASNFGAALRGPGHAWHASMKLICLGELNGGCTEHLARMVNVWSAAGFKVQGYPDIQRMIWQKLICNCALGGPCTLTGMTVGELRDSTEAWAVALACAREAEAVARASGIALDIGSSEAHVTDFASSIRAAKPSMLQDFEAGRRGEVDVINGAVPEQAAKVGLTAPVNETVARLIRAREGLF